MSMHYHVCVIKIDEAVFREVVATSKTMREACLRLHMQYTTFIRHAKRLGIYKPNPGRKGLEKVTCKSITKRDVENVLAGTLVKPWTAYKLKTYMLKFGIAENKCSVCGISDWQGKPLNMELHHIDGNPTNNKADNVQLLCPNCHAQTDNYRSKNLSARREIFDVESRKFRETLAGSADGNPEPSPVIQGRCRD